MNTCSKKKNVIIIIKIMRTNTEICFNIDYTPKCRYARMNIVILLFKYVYF